MKGLELAQSFFCEVGKPAIERDFGVLTSRMAFGLAGEGSECLGFDDEMSQDHDWGPAFCIWLAEADHTQYGTKLTALYESLPRAFAGYERRVTEQAAGRVGAMSVEGFYAKYTGLPRAPVTLAEWLRLPEQALCTATSGSVFEDEAGFFSGIRAALLAFYPEDVRLKKLAARFAIMAQAGQYNFPRSIKRSEGAAANFSRSEFISAAISAAHLLAKRYTPFYKWAWRSLTQISGMENVAEELQKLAEADVFSPENENRIEKTCAELVGKLRQQELTDSGDDFLISHSNSITKRIRDEKIAALHIMQDRWAMEKETLVREIVDAEWQMFDRVQNIGGRADCQDDRRAFFLLRSSQFDAWDEPSLESYRQDLSDAVAAGRNIIELKYAYMMRETDPEYFVKIEDSLPAVPRENMEIIDRLVPIHVRWAEQLYEKQPQMRGIRKIRSAENTVEETSFETYLRGELMTYSLRTLRLYEDFVLGLLERGGNLSLDIAARHLEFVRNGEGF